ncbi:MAG: hypothetical protein FWD61_12070 [Phycisphaerales bacterium]|nr:hypothetical protein [Phycisphaerales bacterium]
MIEIVLSRKFRPDSPIFVEWYRELFGDTSRNHDAICGILAKQARSRAMYVKFPAGCRADIIQEAVLRAISKIGSYKSSRGCPIKYFDKIITRAMWRASGKEQRCIAMTDNSAIDKASSFVIPDVLSTEMARANRERKQKKNVQKIIENRISEVVTAFRNSEAGSPLQDKLRFVLWTLQEVLFEVKGSFSPIRTDGIRYSKSHRLHDLEFA